MKIGGDAMDDKFQDFCDMKSNCSQCPFNNNVIGQCRMIFESVQNFLESKENK